MKNTLLCFFIFVSGLIIAQSVTDPAVQVSAVVQNNPAKITLNWIGNATSTSYQIYRKLKTAPVWGNALATLSGTINQYIDNSVSLGTNYEYKITRTGSGYAGYGYINAGIEVPEISNRGKLVLLIDSSFSATLSSEISRLIYDIEGDGWDVRRHDVSRSASVYHVKSLILNDYHVDSLNLKAVFIFGHVPVPYSGNINPDGHPDHLGAWPADCYYGDIDGNWTDSFITSTTASPARTQNVPGDGKFDQSTIPTDLELQVGRVDFSNMPAFSQSEFQLLKNYLDKDHNYRKKIFQAIKRAVIDDNFGYFSSEAFASSGYKNFAPLVGNTNITAADYITSMTGNSYLWSYGCGGGSYTSASGIGATTNFTNTNLQGVFSMLFGSYFGDWDSQNNFLRAPLAQGNILSNVWSGRPHYQFHHLALGENIGYGLLITQNNNGLYFDSPTGITGRWIHNALMGDPTLRNDVLSPVSNVVATRNNSNCYITWSASTETAIAGYNLYMRNDSFNVYTKLNASPITGNSYTHTCLVYKGIYKYLVRAVKLEQTPSGTYYNMSEGISDTAFNTNDIRSIAAFNYTVIGNKVAFHNLASYPSTFAWDFGNGILSSIANPTATYNNNGLFYVQLAAASNCLNDTTGTVVNITEVGLTKSQLKNTTSIYPNPNQGRFKVLNSLNKNFDLRLFDLLGKMVFEQKNLPNDSEVILEKFPKGIYVIEINVEEATFREQVLID
ncbi:MAG: T9SS type A sorting domain-containing protein [Bacteroidota bacterium]